MQQYYSLLSYQTPLVWARKEQKKAGWKNMLFHRLKIHHPRNDFCLAHKERAESLERCGREVLLDGFSRLPSENAALWLMVFLTLEQARSAEAA